MPPAIAAVLCVMFILWLFRRLAKETRPLSKRLWVPFLWLVILASRPVGYWVQSGEAASDEKLQGSFVDRNTYLFLIVVGSVVLLRTRFRMGEFFARNRLLCYFYGYLLVSILWSDFPFVAFKRWFKDLGNVVMVLLIWSDSDPVEAICNVLARVAYVLIPVSVLFIKYFPTLGRVADKVNYKIYFIGVTTHKNTLGSLAMLSGLVMLWKLVDSPGQPFKRFSITRRWPDLAVLAMCLYLLYRAHSSTSIFCFLLGVTVFLIARLSWMRTHVKNLRWGGLALALVMVLFTISEGFRGVIAGMLGRDVTLTDRTTIWEGLLRMPTNPLIGAGFSSFWLTPLGTDYGLLWRIPHAHNAYLEMYMQTGWIGVIFLLAVLLRVARNASRELYYNTPLGYFFLCITVVGVVYNYTEVAFFRENALETVLWILLVSHGSRVPAGSNGPAPREREPNSELGFELPEAAT